MPRPTATMFADRTALTGTETMYQLLAFGCINLHKIALMDSWTICRSKWRKSWKTSNPALIRTGLHWMARGG